MDRNTIAYLKQKEREEQKQAIQVFGPLVEAIQQLDARIRLLELGFWDKIKIRLTKRKVVDKIVEP